MQLPAERFAHVKCLRLREGRLREISLMRESDRTHLNRVCQMFKFLKYIPTWGIYRTLTAHDNFERCGWCQQTFPARQVLQVIQTRLFSITDSSCSTLLPAEETWRTRKVHRDQDLMIWTRHEWQEQVDHMHELPRKTRLSRTESSECHGFCALFPVGMQNIR